MSLDELNSRLEPTGVDWWIAGGLAIDLFLGWETRPHDDVDVEMFRSDHDALFAAFPGWELHAVSEEGLSPLRRGTDLPETAFGVWGRPDADSPWGVEVILAAGDGRTWRFRRDPSISLPVTNLLRSTRDGLRYSTPEVQLLYKSERARAKDDTDLARCLHRLDDGQSDWLAAAIAKRRPDHPWIAVLANATRMRVTGR